MRGAYPVERVRAAEAVLMAALPEHTLMRRAAAGLAACCARRLSKVYGARVALLVGAGDNGGDALFAGALLARRGAAVTAALLVPDRAHRAGLAALLAAGGRAYPAEPAGAAVRSADLVIDGIVGIGGRGGLRPVAADLVERIGTGSVRVAVDVPSGVDADTGDVPGAVFDADLTVTFGCLKPGLVVGPGRRRAGTVHLVDIGLGPYLPEPDLLVPDLADVAAALPRPVPADDKYTRGVVGVAAGSARYPGAGVLTAGGAVRGGAGMVRYVGSAAGRVVDRWPEAVVRETRPSRAGRVQAWVVGPGIGTGDDAMGVLGEVLASDVPVLVDADAITLVAARPELVRDRAAPTVLTPHDRELARLTGPVGPDRVAAARRAADHLGATVLLKGDTTVIATPGGVTYAAMAGTPWLATAGSGDVLSGLGGATLAAAAARSGERVDDTSAAWAAVLAAFTHGVAGRLAGPGASAGAVLDAVPRAWSHLLDGV